MTRVSEPCSAWSCCDLHAEPLDDLGRHEQRLRTQVGALAE